jgi:formate dehydrogenase major subunit
VEHPYSPVTGSIRSRLKGAQAVVSICPYCAVGCSQLVYVKDGKIIDIEGNYDSPINGGTLCPKGASTYQLSVNPSRPTHVLYRAPYSTEWEIKPLDWAMDRIAHLVKETRDSTFVERQYVEKVGKEVPVMRTEAIGHLGGATLDNEENYLIKKLFNSLGIVAIENQARI